MFKLYFQPKRHAWKQKEAGNAIGSSGIKERRKRVKNLKNSGSWKPTRRVRMNIHEPLAALPHIDFK